MLEIELKIRVPDLTPIRARLQELGAASLGASHEHDLYYNAPHRDFGETDEAVRVRYADGRAVFTYKGPKIREFSFKAREELNTAVESGEVFEKILDRLGFRRTIDVNKWRENFRFEGALVSLDEVDGLGTFVEIEYGSQDRKDAERAIAGIAEKIGVEGTPLLLSYLELILAKRSGVQH
jgi:adenylate cyclase class 2